MNTFKIAYTRREDLIPAAEIIKTGGIVAFPTETVDGLGGNALDAGAAKKIYAAKGRPSDNPLIVHLATPADAEKYCVTSELFYKLADAFMPGPITVIMPKKDCIPYSCTGGLDTVGIRVPSNPVAHEFIELCGCPIAAPSANISGKPSPTSFSHIVHDLDGRVDCLIDGGDCEYGVESTIVKFKDENTIQLLRPGAVTVEMLTLICPTVEIDPAVLKKFGGVPLAPGMKYRHYAPSVPLTILDGGDEEVYEYLRSREKKIGVICYDGDMPFISGEKLSCGGKTDSLTQAHRLFSCLRSFDGRDDLDAIYARMPSKDGIGLAVFNRLIKASGFTVIKL